MSYQQDVQRYYELINQGVSPREAFFNVWPEGLQGAAEKKAKEESKKKQGDELAGVAGTVAGAVATQQAIKHAPSLWETKPPDTTTTTKTETPGQTQPQLDAPEMVSANYAGEPQVISQGAKVPEGMVDVGVANNPDGSQGKLVVPKENVGQDGSVNLGRWAQGAGGAFALYNAYKRYEEGDTVGAGLSAAQGAAAIGSAAGSATAATALPYAGYAMGSYNIHNAINDGSRTRDQKGAEVGKQAGLMVADAFTGGLASLGDAAFRSTGFGRKWGNKIDEATAKYSLGAHALGSVMGGLDTKNTQLKNTQKLMKDAEKSGDPNYLNYIQGARQNTFNEDARKAQKESGFDYAGKYKTFDEYKAAGLEAADLTHVLGNIETFGPEWAELTEEQRQVVTQDMINQGYYISDKGEVNIRKENRPQALERFKTLRDLGFNPELIEMPAQQAPPVNTNGDFSMNGYDQNKMLIQKNPGMEIPQNSAPYPGASMVPPQVSPDQLNQGFNYTPPQGASQYPSIREYLAGLQQGQGDGSGMQNPINKMPGYQIGFGGPMQGITPPQPGMSVPSNPQALAQMQSLGMSQPAQMAPQQGPSQDDVRRSLTMAALERARQRKD